MVRRWDQLNERQLEVLKRIDAAEDLSGPQHGSLRTSANALRDRRLITISKHGGRWEGAITETGRFYLDHGYHPDDPRRGSESEVSQLAERRRAEAVELVARLGVETTVVIANPTEDEVAVWRKIVDFAKRHGMVPEGHRIEKTRQYNRGRDLHIRLIKGAHANTAHQLPDGLPAVSIPETLRSPHKVIADLRDDSNRLVMPKDTRRRCLLVLHGLAVAAIERGYKVAILPDSDSYRGGYQYGRGGHRRDGGISLVVGEFSYAVTVQEVSPQTADPDKMGRIAIELPAYRSEGRQHRWTDGKRRTVEEALPALLHEVETRVMEDRQRQIDEERAKADRKVRWEQAMETAHRKATESYYASALDAQVQRWQHVNDLRAYCQALEQRIIASDPENDSASTGRVWLTWIRDHIATIDPLNEVPTMPVPPKISHEDLKPFLGSWSPYGPEAHQRRW
ncbi:hypothetical protein [Kutzneria chonburiensis]|uniref:PE-PGRS family protein n=1 Tax=Kutzneria chonburiensis TaxID=1483604 RepID=A0ABV6N218_9PSEU|nr:hypothetical protein [Kutzneria chonburiensis]